MNQIQLAQPEVTKNPESYTFPLTGEAVRTVLVDGEPWFAATDVCDILGYAHTGSALRLLDADERRTLDTDGVLGQHTDRRVHQLAMISESGLYSLIIRSHVPGAAAFRRWVTHDVLPALRRTGMYQVPSGPANSAEVVLAMAEAFRDAAHRLVAAETRVAELEPAADAWDTLAAADGDYSLRDAAHILNRDPAISTGQNRLMAFLREEGMVDRKGIPYARHSAHLAERPVSYNHPHTGEAVLTSQIRITTRGLEYLRHRLGGTATTTRRAA